MKPIRDQLYALWRQGAFSVPEGSSGPWRVTRSVITPEQAAENRRQAEMFGDTRHSPAGFYTALIRDDQVWMADTPDEMFDHLEAYEQAAELGGRCLIHGLGLGLITRALLSLPQVEHVDVVELDQDVISLVSAAFEQELESGRLVIHQGDCFVYEWPQDAKWDLVWHDIWQAMAEANLPEMDRLHRAFRGRCRWQGSWGMEWILEQRARRHREGNELGVPATPVAKYARHNDREEA